MLRITPVRDRISERFPVASFVVNAPPDRIFEVACATDPSLFHPRHRHRRTESNFATSRIGGLLRAPAGQATYIVPPQQLRRFAGARRLYYAMAAFRNQRGDEPELTLRADRLEQTPSIQISPDFTGRSLDRGRVEPASARYGAAPTATLGWGGDHVLGEPPRLGGPEPTTATAPSATAAGAASALAYDDGFDPALWSQPAAIAHDTSEDGDSEPAGFEDAPAYGAATRRDRGGDLAEPPGYEDAPAYGAANAEPAGYEDAPARRRVGGAALASGGAHQHGLPSPTPALYATPAPAAPRARYGGALPPAVLGPPAARAHGGALHHERYGSCAPRAGAQELAWERASAPPRSDEDGYEDVPDLVRHLGARYRAFGGAEPATDGAAPAPAPPTGPAAPAGAAGDGPARFADFSEDLTEPEPLPVAAWALADDTSFAADDPRHRLRILHRVAQAESGNAGYAAINPDREFSDPSLPELYQRKHVGLSWGFVQFAQRFGGLGFALRICNRRDPDAFARIFGAHHAAPASEELPALPAGHLLAVTNATDEEARLAPVVPPGGGAPTVLWSEPWLAAFTEAGAVTSFQEAQREAADRRYYAPYVEVLAQLGLASPRGQAMFVDRSIHMGPGGALRWILRTVGPIRSQDQLAAALTFLGHADVRAFQAASGLGADGVFGPRTHAAMMRALRGAAGAPVTVPSEETMLDALCAEADRQAAQSPSRLWRLTAQRLRALRADPSLAGLPPAPGQGDGR